MISTSPRSDIYTVDDIRVSVAEDGQGVATVTLQDSKTGLIMFPASLADYLASAIGRARENFRDRREAL